MIICYLFIIILMNHSAIAQNQFKAVVKDHDTKEPVTGVNVFIPGTQIGSATNEEGYVEIRNIPDGTFEIIFSSIGYKEEIISISFPASEELVEIEIESEIEEFEEISISSTRSSRLISSEPTRVEVIAGEEIDEKISMDPSNISMMLNESTGIQVQQTSASSVNSTFRIQGLEGRYTQLLKDGFPLYSGYSGSLSIMQIPPLDLKQIEIIKGSSSTLYGGGAIAGLINLISKDPDPEGELSLLLNGTSAGGIDISGYYSKKFSGTGITLLAARNTQSAYDNNDDKFSDLPEIERYSLTPKLVFYFDAESRFEAGGSIIMEDRTGGSLPVIEGVPDQLFTYTEKNTSRRAATQVKYEAALSDATTILFKNSVGYFKRDLEIPSYSFSGTQISTFSEAAVSSKKENLNWILGVNLITENFNDQSRINYNRDYSDLTAGVFSQAVLDFSEAHSLEAGLRFDYAKEYDVFVLPRISLLSKWSTSVTTRLGGGFGYKLPTIFTERSEEIFYRNVIPLDKNKINAEKSIGVNFDLNYNTILFKSVTFSCNNLIFYTRINDPLVITPTAINNQLLEFISFSGHYDTRGIETNLKLTYNHLKLFAGYAFTSAVSHNNDRSDFPLTPKHKVGLVLVFEEHENYRIGFEAYYTGNQKLTNGQSVTDFWINGLMIEKYFNNISLFLNFENFLDTRQSRYGRMYSGPPTDPIFTEIYAPTDGRIINGGAKIRL